MNEFNVKLCDYKNLTIELDSPTPSVTIDEVEEQKKQIAQEYTELEAVDGPLQNGHTSVIDFVGSVDGVEFEGGKAENYKLVIGSGMFIPGFEDQMVGMEKGEVRIIKVRFPEEYTPELAGKDAEFKVTLHDIKVKPPVEFNDKVLKKFTEAQGLEALDSIEKFDKFLCEAIYRQKTDAVNKEISEKIASSLVAGCTLDLPEELICEHVESQMKQYSSYAEANGMNLDTLLSMMGQNIDSFKADVEKEVKENISISAILEEIARVEGIVADENDISEFYANACSAKNATLEQMKEEYPEEEAKKYISFMKASSLVRSSAKISHK